jgi:hypothetical protein
MSVHGDDVAFITELPTTSDDTPCRGRNTRFAGFCFGD